MSGMAISDLAQSVNWVFGLVVGDDDVSRMGVNALRFYAGWGDIRSLSPVFDADGNPSVLKPTLADSIDEFTELTDGEWAIVKPLLCLYVERENARALEASRGNGVEVFGRAVSEVEQDIRAYETELLPRLAFSCQIETI